MTPRKTDILNVRLDAELAEEIERIAAWRGKTASEVARDLLRLGVSAERDLEAEELKRPYGNARINRNAANVRVVVEAHYRFYTMAEMAEFDQAYETGDVVEVFPRRHEAVASYRPLDGRAGAARADGKLVPEL